MNINLNFKKDFEGENMSITKSEYILGFRTARDNKDWEKAWY